ncbi:hypothetical protein ACFOWX_12270 [Sphingorhabdus arenilitoris]|uniref:Uncharacterized protein n=1 Tax=Sphingorhabdus arenilitoris TaxID=1490041 RepID=A0ABV8RLP2_9SPHN
MGMISPNNNQMKAIMMAIGGSVIAAAGTMFIPVSILESITGATGLSELFPATAAPLGDTARALIAFGTGAVALLLLLALVLRPKEGEMASEARSEAVDHHAARSAAESGQQSGGAFAAIKQRLAGLIRPKMPWQRGEDDIFDLADLPKLRGQDSHPDAPVRKPISALTDLAGADLMGDQQAAAPNISKLAASPEQEAWMAAQEPNIAVSPEPAQPSAPLPAPPLPATPVDQPAPTAKPAPTTKPGASLAEMVAQMEAAVAERKKQLDELEKVAAQMLRAQAEPQIAVQAHQQADAEPPIAPPAAPLPVPSPAQERADPKPMTRPPLEAVPASPPQPVNAAAEEEMDDALNAALETLRRMNNR